MPPVGSRIEREKVLDDEARAKIYARINSNEGASFTELRALLDYFDFLEIQKSTLRHHLDILEKNEFIKSRWDGYRILFYTSDFRIPNKPVLSRVEDAILSAIGENQGCSGEELAEKMNRSPSTVSYHVRRLVGYGLARVQRRGRRAEVYRVE